MQVEPEHSNTYAEIRGYDSVIDEQYHNNDGDQMTEDRSAIEKFGCHVPLCVTRQLESNPLLHNYGRMKGDEIHNGTENCMG
eukprot:6393046-Ditylum_brightwellii.AAC.1